MMYTEIVHGKSRYTFINFYEISTASINDQVEIGQI